MRKILIFCACMLFSCNIHAQNYNIKSKVFDDLRTYFYSYTPKDGVLPRQARVEKINVDNNKKTVAIVTNSNFAQQSFTKKSVGKIYKRVRKCLPKSLRKYKLTIITNGMPLENYIPGHTLALNEGHALWGKIDYDDEPWVKDMSSPLNSSLGLDGRHISLWASHGRYYKNDKNRWEWQRPYLFCTTEDLFTQTIVLPFLVPMLQNAGAIVFTPRERDWQTMEYIVDPDGGLNTSASSYIEYSEGKRWTSTGLPGFAAHSGSYVDNENPFTAGTAKQIKSTKKAGKSFAIWQPTFQKKGKYAVYVSYQTVKKSVEDAHYTVFHQGMATEFVVNQKMGGGTWVYLGTFTFDKGNSVDNSVMLTNQSHDKGVVTADAVRFGGGMGNIERGGMTSGYPRALEGARYTAQWSGAPYKVYGGRGGSNDYADDINTRSLMENWLSGGSVYNPTQEGKNVPIELSLAIHSDAGYAENGKDKWGSLAICTTNFNDGRLNSGVTRQSSKLYASALLNGAVRDLSYKYGNWPKRYLWDRNYSETRLPAVPSAIIETLSHQNFPDMMLGQDPNFKFDLARSIYKTTARFINGMHGRPTVIEPLQPKDISVILDDDEAELSWIPQTDPLEPTAEPTYYIVYTAIGNGSFDNGVKTNNTSFKCKLQPGIPYHFKVAAGNRGGKSFPTEVVSAVYEPNATKTVLIVNGFNRLSAPAVVDDDYSQGFDLDKDLGVSYGLAAGWSGRQTCFNKSRMGIESSTGLGYSGNELSGRFIAGNDFNYVMTHAEAIASAHRYNVVSCSSKAVETGIVDMNKYDIVDLLLGLEKFTPEQTKYYKTFSAMMQRKINKYAAHGGSMLVSGAYVGSDNELGDNRQWLEQTFHVQPGGTLSTDTISGVNGMGLNGFDFYRQINPDHYSVQHCDKLQPTGGAFCTMQYNDGSSAAVGYNGSQFKSLVMGFPFETITDKSTRNNIMRGMLSFLGSTSNQ